MAILACLPLLLAETQICVSTQSSSRASLVDGRTMVSASHIHSCYPHHLKREADFDALRSRLRRLMKTFSCPFEAGFVFIPMYRRVQAFSLVKARKCGFLIFLRVSRLRKTSVTKPGGASLHDGSRSLGSYTCVAGRARGLPSRHCREDACRPVPVCGF